MPTDDCKCVVDYTMSVDGKVVEEKKDFHFVIGDEPVICDGFEKGVESMNLGEICTFTLEPKYAFGEQGDASRNIPANTPVTFHIELKAMEQVPTPFTIAPESIVKHAEDKKVQGNALVKKQMHKRALRCYMRALDYLDNDYRIPEDQKEAAKKIQNILYLNAAAMHLHLKEYPKVIEFADMVLKADDKNLKAYLRRGKAHIELKQLSAAEADFLKALDLDPSNGDAKNGMAIINRAKAEETKKDKQRYAKMFSALGSLSDDEPKKEVKMEEEKKEEPAKMEEA